ncbi:hypothetical protein HDV02_002482 [Globomyces sp. JEL0801]|nr:hypothetical protein HDV02_002482 [Globomyces sp. JEL0801]
MPNLVDDGWIPTFVEPSNESEKNIVVAYRRGLEKLVLNHDYKPCDITGKDIKTKHTAIDPNSDVGVVPSGNSGIRLARAVTIEGLSPFADTKVGIHSTIIKPQHMTYMAFDLEQSTLVRRGRFPLPTDPLISSSIVTRCGKRLLGYMVGNVNTSKLSSEDLYQAFRFTNSKDIADWTISTIADYNPDFLCVHNGYRYDFGILAAHCSMKYSNMFSEVNLGAKDKGMTLNIHGVNIVDTWWFIQKLHGQDYPSTSLSSIAVALGLPDKLPMDHFNIDTNDEAFDYTHAGLYNVHDSYLCLEIAIKSKCIDELIALSVLTKSPISDCSKFLSGSLMANITSTYCLSQNAVMDWSIEPPKYGKYKGAYVVSPEAGLYDNVLVYDFASLYPSIMISANISTESVDSILTSTFHNAMYDLSYDYTMQEDSVCWTHECIFVGFKDHVSVIYREPEGVQCALLNTLISTRRTIKKSNAGKDTSLSYAMKICANSLYGAMGSSTSGLCSFYGASSITTIGRWLLSVAIGISRSIGCTVVYGDTDSVFIVCPSNIASDETFTKIFHSIMKYTPFGNIKLEFERRFHKLIMLKRKMYFGSSLNKGLYSYMAKGIAVRRKDRTLLSRLTLNRVCEIITSNSKLEAEKLIADILLHLLMYIDSRKYTVSECSKEMKIRGIPNYVFVMNDGTIASTPVDVPFKDIDKVCNRTLWQSISSVVDNVLSVCGMKSTDVMVRTLVRSMDYIDNNEDLSQFYTTSEVLGDDYTGNISSIHNSMAIKDWRAELSCGNKIDNYLPLRKSLEIYQREGFRGSVTEVRASSAMPEIVYSKFRTNSHIPRLFTPHFGYVCMLNKNPSVKDNSDTFPITLMCRNLNLSDTLLKIRNTRMAWISSHFNEVIVDSDHKLWLLFQCMPIPPLHAFNIHALIEHKSARNSSILWTKMYDTLQENVPDVGMYSVIHNNSLIDCRCYEERDNESKSYDERNHNLRHMRADWYGFIDPVYTPLSLEAGKIRSLVNGCMYRVLNTELIAKCSSVLSMLEARISGHGSGIMVHFHGATLMVEESCLVELGHMLRQMKGYQVPSVHYFSKSKLLSISISSGCIMKPLCNSINDMIQGPNTLHWCDSLHYRSPDIDIRRVQYIHTPINMLLRLTVSMFPFSLYDEPPRPTLASNMAVQAICIPFSSTASTIRPKSLCLPILRTPCLEAIIQANVLYSKGIPGVPLLVVYANMDYNYEDAVVIHERVNKNKWFAHEGFLYHPLPQDVESPLTNSTTNNTKDTWWRPYDQGKTILSTFTKTKSRTVLSYLESDRLHVGDKLATMHGQKFTVSKILTEDEMIKCRCNKTGEIFTPDIIIASSSIHNRGTLGQLYESWLSINIVGTTNFDRISIGSKINKVVDYDYDVKTIIPRTCQIISDHSQKLQPSITADYGISQIWQLYHLVRDKQHYMSNPIRGIGEVRGRLRGSSVRIGEMEMHAMMSAGLINCLNEIITSGDMETKHFMRL